MSGTASHSATDSSYSGTVEMKKVAALGESFGLFSYLDSGNQADVATASCFQEASLHVVGSISLFSKWADLELGNFTDWSGSTLYQSSYLFSRAGTADPVRQARGVDPQGRRGGAGRAELQRLDLLACRRRQGIARDRCSSAGLVAGQRGLILLTLSLRQAKRRGNPE